MAFSSHKSITPWKLVIFVAAVACACAPLFVHNDYLMQVFFRIALFAALGLAWNLVGGYAGQLSLGHVAFFGVGAYGLALFTEASIPIWISVVLAALVATLFATIIGRIAFPLRGPYFTLAPIAFAEVLRLIATDLEATGGAIGLTTPSLFTRPPFLKLFYVSASFLPLLAFAVNFWVSR